MLELLSRPLIIVFRFGIEMDEALRVGVPDFRESPMAEKKMKALLSTESLLGLGTSLGPKLKTTNLT